MYGKTHPVIVSFTNMPRLPLAGLGSSCRAHNFLFWRIHHTEKAMSERRRCYTFYFHFFSSIYKKKKIIMESGKSGKGGRGKQTTSTTYHIAEPRVAIIKQFG